MSLVMGLASVARAEDIEVPQEFPTISAALAAAQSGDTVLVDYGLYFETVEIGPGICLVAMNEHRPYLLAPDEGAGSTVFFLGTGTSVDAPASIRGFTLAGAGDFGPPVVRSRNPNTLIEDCVIRAGGPPMWFDPIVYLESGGIVRRCDVDGGRQSAMFLSSDPGAVMVIEDSILGPMIFGESMSGFGSGSVTIFRHNTLIDPFIIGLVRSSYTDFSIRFENSIFWNTNLIHCENPSPDDLEFRYNCWYPYNPVEEQGVCPGSLGPGNFTADPLICDDPDRKWWLTPESPCIGAGEDGGDIGARLGTCGVTAVDEMIGGFDLQLSAPWPNPTTGSTNLMLSNGLGASVRIFDPSGRLVSSWSNSGEQIHWDGRFADGRLAPAGAYLLEVQSGKEQATRTVTILR